MRCNEARQQLDRLDWSGEAGIAGDLLTHLNDCDACRDHARERQLVGLLASLPIRRAAPGFEDRVMDRALAGNARVQAGMHARWALATAASVLLAVFLTLQFHPSGINEPVPSVEGAVIEVRPLETRIVTVRLTSPGELRNVLLTVQLDENLELEGYAGIHDLTWRTTLESGPNELALPVRLLAEDSGMLTVLLQHGDTAKRFSVRVNAAVDNDHRGPKLTMAWRNGVSRKDAGRPA